MVEEDGKTQMNGLCRARTCKEKGLVVHREAELDELMGLLGQEYICVGYEGTLSKIPSSCLHIDWQQPRQVRYGHFGQRLRTKVTGGKCNKKWKISCRKLLADM
jgi:hypothetical protein